MVNFNKRLTAGGLGEINEIIISCRKLHHIRLSGSALGKPKKNDNRDKKQDYVDECERIEVERRLFSKT